MNIILKTLITTTALVASLSIASAKSTDGYGSAGLNDLDFKKQYLRSHNRKSATTQI